MLTINASELVLTIASFFLLLFLLKKLLYDPVTSFMEQRQARIDAGLLEAQQADERVEQLKTENQRQLEDTRKQADTLVAQGKAADEQQLIENIRLLQQQSQSASAEAKAQAEKLREKGKEELSAISPRLAELLAERLLEK